MNLIGRKQYHAWSENLTVGLGLLTDRWSGFVDNPAEGAVARLYDLYDVCGEILANDIGAPVRTPFGRDVNDHVTIPDAWTPADGTHQLPPGFCGRRLVTTWTDTTMLSIDKIVGHPRRFGVACRPGSSAMLCDIVETLGELTEVQVGRPQARAYGRDANYLVVAGTTWLAEGESLDDRLSFLPGHAGTIRASQPGPGI